MNISTKYLPICLAASTLVLSGCGKGDDDKSSSPATSVQQFAAKVTACGTGDTPETGLQGQVPAALRQSGFKGFNCNIELVGQFRGEGGNWSAATFKDKAGRICAYHSTGTPAVPGTPGAVPRQNPGVPVIDITDPSKPVRTMSLTTKAMLDPWESLRVNQPRQLLMGDNGTNSGGGPEVDVYDLAADCTSPQLMSSVALSYSTGDPAAPEKPINGHEGNVSPDGLTYYVGDLTNGKYHAVDITNPTRPKVIATYDMKTQSPIAKVPHGLSVSADGNRIYVAAIAFPTTAQLADPNYAQNGFLVLDTSEVQARKPNAQIRLVSSVAFRDGSVAQHTIETKIGGKPYLVMVDEGGSGGLSDTAAAKSACVAGLAPFPMARIFDMSDEKNPKVVSKLGLETHDTKNCDTVLPDITGLSTFTYGSHYCSVDSRENATAMACSYFNSGIRVFDIRNPAQPKEIAYFNPPGATTPVPGSNHVAFNQWKPGGPDWCASRLDFDKERGLITTMCQDNGLLVMRFKNGVWPFSDTVASTSQN
jgi:hypothetical protein